MTLLIQTQLSLNDNTAQQIPLMLNNAMTLLHYRCYLHPITIILLYYKTLKKQNTVHNFFK